MAKSDKTAEPSLDAGGEALPEAPPPPPAAVYLAPRTIEEWQEIKATPAWAHEAAKSLKHWPLGKIATADEYDAAITAAHRIEVS